MEQEPKRKFKINKMRTATFVAGATLALGGAFSSYYAEERTRDEEAKNNQTIGALEHHLSEELDRPQEKAVYNSLTFVQNYVDEIKSKPENIDIEEASSVTGSLVSSESEIERHDSILAREKNYQQTLGRIVDEAGLNDTDDANRYASLGGVFAAAIGTIAGTFSLVKPNKQHRIS